MRFLRSLLPLASLLTLTAPLARAADTSVTISYDGHSKVYTAAALAALPHQDVAQFDMREKKNHVYSGVAVAGLLAAAGLPSGEKFRGKDLREVVLVRCRDHYEVAFGLADFNPDFGDRTIILADRRDGQPLPDAIGPFRLVVAGDRRPSRSAHRVTSIGVFPAGEGR